MMRRIKNGLEYYTLCGGKVDPGETPEQACVREVLEETSISIAINNEIHRDQDIFQDIPNTHIIYACTYITGEPVLGGEEVARCTPDNYYEPLWLAIKDLETITIKPDWLAQLFQSQPFKQQIASQCLIGPHEGRELELMLSGTKPAAMFYDVFPSREFIPAEKFLPYVKKGHILAKEVTFNIEKFNCITTYMFYALPSESWRIDQLEKLQRSFIDGTCTDSNATNREIGKLLGYSDEAIDFYLIILRR